MMKRRIVPRTSSRPSRLLRVPRNQTPHPDGATASATASRGPSRNQRIAKVLSEHLGIVLSLLVLLLTSIKIFVFSHGDPTTVAAVVGQQGISGVLAAATVATLPTLAVFIGFAGIFDLAEAIREQDRLRGPVTSFVFSAAVAVVFAGSKTFWILAAYAAAMIAYSVVAVLWRSWAASRQTLVPWVIRKSSVTQQSRSGVLLVSITLLLVVVLGTFTDTSWLPRERLMFEGKPPLIGYVLSDDGAFLHIVDSADRRPTMVLTTDVKGRDYCDPFEGPSQSVVAELIWRDRNVHAVAC